MSDNILPLVTDAGGRVHAGVSIATLGCGFKPNFQKGESPFKGKVFKSSHVKKPKVESLSFSEVMDSVDKVKKHLNIDGHLGVSYGPMISGEGAGEYLKSSTARRRKTTLCYRVQHVHSYTHLKSKSLEQGLDKCWDPETFETYGTMFVDQVFWGSQLDLTFSIESEEDEDLTDLMTSLEGSIGYGPLTLNFKAKFEEHNKTSSNKLKMSIQARASGVTVTIPANPSIDNVVEIINEFNKEYKALVEREEKLESQDETLMTPLAFVLGRTQDFINKPNTVELSFLNEKMKRLSETFMSLSYWKEMLLNAKCDNESRYLTPHARETILHPYKLKIENEIQLIGRKQEECLLYRQLPLSKMLGWDGESPAESPGIYPNSKEEKRIEGLLGKGYIPFPIHFDGKDMNYHFEGYVIENGDNYEACLDGKLITNEKVVASGLAREFYDFTPLNNHVFDPSFLKTSIITASDSINYEHGDLFVPDDMKEILQRTIGNGDFLKPVFCNKRLVLMGPMGAGKSSLFNRLTNTHTQTSDGSKTCTVKNSTGNAIGPAKDLLIIDTPGTAGSVTNSMTVDQALELRRALTQGDVSQIAVVIAVPNNTRAQAYCDQLEPLKDIFDCSTFRQDINGVDVVMRGKRSSPHRTRPFVIVTHRDKFSPNGRVQIRNIMDKMRQDFPWIGPVAFIDQNVSLTWLYNTIIACAGFRGENQTNYNIPLVEMFSQFKISFPPVKDEWVNIIETAKQELNNCMACIEHKLRDIDNIVINDSEQVKGNHVDGVAPRLDCFMKAMDDMFERTAHETLAKCYETTVSQLFDDIDNTDLLNERATLLNTIKRDLSQVMFRVRRNINAKFPTHGESAVYKKCPNPKCSAVYMKPTGCNYLGQCGLKAGAKQDEHHNGSMVTSLQYEFNWNNNVETSLTIFEGKNVGKYEAFVMNLRRNLRKAASRAPINQREEYMDPPVENGAADYGCGRELRWNSMIPLSTAEMVEKGLLPKSAKEDFYEPVEDITTMTVDTFLVSKCGEAYEKYIQGFKKNGIRQMKDLLDVWNEADADDLLKELIKNNIHRRIIKAKVNDFRNNGQVL